MTDFKADVRIATEEKKEETSEFERRLSKVTSGLSVLVKASLLISGIILAGWLWGKKDDLFAILSRTTSVKVQEVEIQFSPVKHSQGMPATVDLVAFDRASEATLELKKIHAVPGDGAEYILVKALRDVDLSKGFVGDGDELLRIQRPDLSLKKGEEVQIFTYCGPRVPAVVLAPMDQLSIWHGACLAAIKTLDSSNDKFPKWYPTWVASEASYFVDYAERNFEPQYFEGTQSQCGKVYSELKRRKLYRHATGSQPFALPLELDIESLQTDVKTWAHPADFGSKLDKKTLDAMTEPRECDRAFEGTNLPENQPKETLTLCLDTSPLHGQMDAPPEIRTAVEVKECIQKCKDEEGSSADLLSEACVRDKENAKGLAELASRVCTQTKDKKQCEGKCDAKPKNQHPIECMEGFPRFLGMFKGDPGEGDRVLVLTKDHEVALDVEYWWPGNH